MERDENWKENLSIIILNCGLFVFLKNFWRWWKVCRFFVFFYFGGKRIVNLKLLIK